MKPAGSSNVDAAVGKKEIDRCLALLAKYIRNFQVFLKIPDQI